MCLAICKPAGKSVSEDNLRNGFLNNSDGAGFAVATPAGELVIRKGFMKFDTFWDAWKKVEQLPALIHFRQATHGETSERNCHPFLFGNGQYALVHNGCLPIKCNVDEKLSDTWHFTTLVLEPLLACGADLGEPWVKWLVEQAIGCSNKVAVLKSDGTSIVWNSSAGKTVDDVWYSNDSYESVRSSFFRPYGGWADDYEDYWNPHRNCAETRSASETHVSGGRLYRKGPDGKWSEDVVLREYGVEDEEIEEDIETLESMGMSRASAIEIIRHGNNQIM